MKNNYLHPQNLKDNSVMFQSRIQELPSLINSLKFKDVEDDAIFEKNTQRIKDTVLLKPIVIKDTEFVDFEYEHKPVRMEQRFFGNPSTDNYVHEIKIHFEGDSELFIHSYNGMSYSSSDNGVIQPQSSNSVTIFVELNELSPENAIIQAQSLFALTKKIGENNSKTAEMWNTALEKKIDDDLKNKRDELFRIFKK